MPYPINYDFGKNWDKKIRPHLDNPKIKRAIKNGVNDYLDNFPTDKRYKSNTIPANYSSKDGYAMLMDRKRDEFFEGLRIAGLLSKKFLEFEKKYKKNYNDDIGYEYMIKREKILDPCFTWENLKYDLETYYLSGSCFSWAPTFELTLAKLVEPKEKWRVREGDEHATVINEDNSKVFDLLYWASSDRLENYMFGDKVTEDDPTLGGKAAFIDSMPGY